MAPSETAYDALGRVYQQTTYAVDPATGAIGNALTANTWYDLAGQCHQAAAGRAQAFTKTAYDGLGRVIAGLCRLRSRRDHLGGCVVRGQ